MIYAIERTKTKNEKMLRGPGAISPDLILNVHFSLGDT